MRSVICSVLLAIVCLSAQAVEETNDELLNELVLESRLNSYLSRQKRVIGGDITANDEDHPWLVSLQGTKSGWWFVKGSQVYCGGSVISDQWVLSAAHCFSGKMFKASKWEVRLATRKLKEGIVDIIGNIFGHLFKNKDWMDFEVDVEKIVRHGNYDKTRTWLNDIALVKLKKKVPFFDQLKAIALPPQDATDWPADGQKCAMFGWGCTQKGGSVARKTMKVILPKVSDNTCRRRWGVSTETRICAGYNYNGKGICPGDSGGPLICKDAEGKYVQAGIASFTSANAPGDHPGAFTRVSKYTKWIQYVMKNY